MKSFLLLPLLLVAILFSSCKKEEITQMVQPNLTVYADVKQTAWSAPGANDEQSYVTQIPMPEIDARTLQTDGVLVYLTTDGGKSYEALPDVVSGVTIYYRYTQGNLYLYSQGFDGTPVNPGFDFTAKIVLVASDAE